MTASNRRLWTAAIFGAILLGGAAMMVRGAVVVELRTAFDASNWQLGLIAPAGTVGYLLVVALVGLRASRLDSRRLVVLGLAGSTLALVAMSLAPLLGVFLLAVFVRGTMNGVVRGLNRPLLSHFYPERRGRIYGYYDMAWGFGATLGPLLVVAAVATRSWRLTYYVLAALTGLLTVVVWRLDAPDVTTEEERFDLGDVRRLLRRPEVLAMALGMFFGTGVEGGLYIWLPTYASSELPAAVAKVTLSVLLAGYVPGRFLYGRLGARVGYLRLLVPVLCLLVPAFVLTFVVASGYWILPGVALIGALVSGVFPLLISYATEAVPQHSGPVTAIAAVSSSAGVGTVPALMGFVVSGSDATAAMRWLLLPLGLAVAVLVAARVAEWRRSPTPA